MKRRIRYLLTLPVFASILSVGSVFASWTHSPASMDFDETKDIGIQINSTWTFPKTILANVHSYSSGEDSSLTMNEVTPSEGYIQQWECDVTTTDDDHADITFSIDGVTNSYTLDSDISWHANDNAKTTFRAFYGATYHFVMRYDGSNYFLSCTDDNPSDTAVLLLNVNSAYSYIYLWKDGGSSNSAWPGATLGTPWTSNQSGKPLYYKRFTKGQYEKMIINDNKGSQTANIDLPSKGSFSHTFFWLDSHTNGKYGFVQTI